jgi:hypothetical protein
MLAGLLAGLFMVGALVITGCTTQKVEPTGPGNAYEVDTPAPTSVTVTGVVSDPDVTLVVVAVVRLDDGRSTVTDGKGTYHFDDVEAGGHGVAIYKQGHTAGYRAIVVSGDKADVDPVVVKPFERVDGYVEHPAPMSGEGAVEEAVLVETVSDGQDGRPAVAAVAVPKGVKITGQDGQLLATEGALQVSVAPLSISEVPGLVGGSEVVGGRIEKDFPIASAEFGPSGVVFDRPVMITIGLPMRLSPGAQLHLQFYNEGNEEWEDAMAKDGAQVFAKVNADGRSASAEVWHFTTYGVLLKFTVDRPAQPTQITTSSVVKNIAQDGPADIDLQLGGTVTFSGESSTNFQNIAKTFLEIEFGLSRGRLSAGFIPSRISFTDRTISRVTVTVSEETFSGITVSLKWRNPVTLADETIDSGGATVTKKRLGSVEVTRTIPAGHASGHASGHSSGGIHDSGIGF